MLTEKDVLLKMDVHLADKVKIIGYGNEIFICKWKPFYGFVFVSKNQEIALKGLTLDQIQNLKPVVNRILLKHVLCKDMWCCNCPLRHIKCDSNQAYNETLGKIYSENLSNNEKFVRKDVLSKIETLLEQEYEEGIDYEKEIFGE